MTNHKEEQELELEALKSIYPEEFSSEYFSRVHDYVNTYTCKSIGNRLNTTLHEFISLLMDTSVFFLKFLKCSWKTLKFKSLPLILAINTKCTSSSRSFDYKILYKILELPSH